MAENFKEKFINLIRSGFSGVWIECVDIFETQKKIADAVKEYNAGVKDNDKRPVLSWNASTGWSDSENASNANALVQFMRRGVVAPSVCVLQNFHKFTHMPEVCARLLEYSIEGACCGGMYVVLAPLGSHPPAELSQRFYTFTDSPPSLELLEEVAARLAEANDIKVSPEDCKLAARAACGLTLHEATNLFSLSLVADRGYNYERIMEMKASSVAASGFMELHYKGAGYESLGGLNQLKQFCYTCLTHNDPLVRPRGVLLLGVPGTGKSAFCRALGVETKRPVVVANIGALYGSLVGQTEQNVRKLLSFVDSIAPCILFIDEVEKALSGLQSSGKTDSGVSARVFGTLLTWLNDHETDVYTVVTSNDITKLPPEFSRSERFDALFFLDIPNEKERTKIWEIYLTQYSLDLLKIEDYVKLSQRWTGAEIKTCCRLSRLLKISPESAANFIVPVAETMQEQLEALTTWASGRCLHATLPGVYFKGRGSDGSVNFGERRLNLEM